MALGDWQNRLLKWMPLGLLIVLLGVVLILAGRIKAKKEDLDAHKAAQVKQERPLINVVTYDLTPGPIRERLSLPGVVAPWVNLEVVNEVSGKVLDLAFKQGDQVARGDVLVRLEDRDYRNTLNSVTASFESAKSTYERLKDLQQRRISTKDQLETAEAQMKNYKAAMDTARLNLERCVVRAPISGFVNQRFVEKGQFLSPASKVAEIIKIDRVKVTVGIPEADVEAVRRLDAFQVQIDALGGKIVGGRKYFLSRTADPLARLYNLEIALENPATEILPDMFVRVEIIKQEKQDVISAPLYALIPKGDQYTAFVAEDGLAHARTVSIGLREGWRVEITEGLSAGEDLIVVGQRGVNDGQGVNVLRSVSDIKDIMQ